MAESTSPPIARSPHKLLEYTSCIDTNVSSSKPISTCGNINAHSSFDLISQARDCDTLVKPHENNHRILERDLRRIDNDTNKHIIEIQNKKLDRTESISLPSTPIEHLSSKYHRSLFLTPPNKTHSDDDDDDDDLDDDDDDDDDDDGIDDRNFRYASSTDYMTATPDQMPDGSIFDLKNNTVSSNSSSTSPPLPPPPPLLLPPLSETNIPMSYGVDWTDRTYSTSHCWYPYIPTDLTSSPACSFFSCKNPKPSLLLALVQCESCFLIVHTHHLSNLSTIQTNLMPSCRPSFFDDNDEPNKSDQHFWSNISVLSKPCTFCKRKSMSNPIFSGNNRPSTMPTLDIMTKGTTYSKSPIPDSPKLSGSTGGLQCLWCSRGYHRRCWEQIFNHEDRNKCDYGLFRQIIVRPQWIRRLPGYTPLFRAQYFNDNDRGTNYTPLLLFINKRSGGQSGEKIYRKLLHLLNPRQVFLLENDRTIIDALDIYSSLSNIRICVFGGDGTVGWVLSCLAEIYPSLNNPPVCICPLGTGNDLSRVLSWGEQYDPKRLLSTLIQIPHAKSIALDRWQVTLEPLDATNSNTTTTTTSNNIGRTFLSFITQPKFIRDTTRASYQNHRTLPNSRFINYMSFGLDAAIALEFHHRRTRNPRKFSSPLKNKLMYLNESCKYLNDFARSKLWNLSSYIRLICDGENLTEQIKNCHTLLVLNIPGYASGTNPWGKSSNNSCSSPPTSIQKDSDSFEQISTGSVELNDLPANAHDVYEVITLNECSNDQFNTSSTTTMNTSASRFERQDFGDKKIEVVGLSTTHMATIHMGFRGIRIAQCDQLRIESCGPMTAQMDGEPFYIPESAAFNITHAGQVLVLQNRN